MEAQMPVRSLTGQFQTIPPPRDSGTPDVFRVLDWTNLDAAPTTLDIARLANMAGHGTARVAILVNTPRMLRAATAFSEHASLQGVQVRVFVDSSEALSWLYKPLPAGMPVPGDM
jgi:hypothetical protein